MAVATVRDKAQALRAGLIGGFVSIPDVVTWADRLIGEDHGRDAPQLFDLALLRPGDVGRAVSLLGEVPGEWHPGTVGRDIARRPSSGGFQCGEERRVEKNDHRARWPWPRLGLALTGG